MILLKTQNRKTPHTCTAKVRAGKSMDCPSALVELGVYSHTSIKATIELDDESAIQLCRGILKRFKYLVFQVQE